MKRKLLVALFLILALLCFAGCSTDTAEPTDSPIAAPTAEATEAPDMVSEEDEVVAEEPTAIDLNGHTLSIYCGAGMTKPFQEIADAFEAATGCGMEITFGNAGQTQAQINTAQEGDLFIAGSADEVEPIKDVVTGSSDLVKHIPVLVVKSGNPLGITGLADLANEGVRVVFGDAESTPIGKIANKALTNLGILDQVNVVARTATAPSTFNALLMDECDVILVWKENVTDEAAEIVDAPDMEKYIKTIPAASLSCCDDEEALAVFLGYLDSDDAHVIWQSYGYEVIE